MLVGVMPVASAQESTAITSASQLQIDAIIALVSTNQDQALTMLDAGIQNGSITPEMLQQIIATLNANGMEDLAGYLANKYAELLLGVEPAAGPADVSGQ